MIATSPRFRTSNKSMSWFLFVANDLKKILSRSRTHRHRCSKMTWWNRANSFSECTTRIETEPPSDLQRLRLHTQPTRTETEPTSNLQRLRKSLGTPSLYETGIGKNIRPCVKQVSEKSGARSETKPPGSAKVVFVVQVRNKTTRIS